MQAQRIAGSEAGSRKYDLITALGCHALSRDKPTQRAVLRLITLMTARYNWRSGLLTVGQREIARLWSVDERTVKREMARMRAAGWLVVESAARRGRVASYRIDLDRILMETEPSWARVGPDFDARMRREAGQGASVPERTVVPFPTAFPRPSIGVHSGETEWRQARALLEAREPLLFRNWFECLTREDRVGTLVVLRAPSPFHADYLRAKLNDTLLAALSAVDPAVGEVRIIA